MKINIKTLLLIFTFTTITIGGLSVIANAHQTTHTQQSADLQDIMDEIEALDNKVTNRFDNQANRLSNLRGNITLLKNSDIEIKKNLTKVDASTEFQIQVWGTQYAVGDTANIFAKISEAGASSQNINSAFCDYQIFYDNNSIAKVGVLTHIPLSRGVYNDVFTIDDNVTGNRILDVSCFDPHNETSQNFFFSGVAPADLKFLNSTGVNPENQSFGDMGQSAPTTIPRFTQEPSSLGDEFQEFRFLDNITNINGWFQCVGCIETFLIRYDFYRLDNLGGGSILIGSTQNQTEISLTPTEVIFDNSTINFPFQDDSVIQVEITATLIGTDGKELVFQFNDSSLANSGFVVNSKQIESPVDIFLGGSSELSITTLGFGQTGNINSSLGNLLGDIEDLINNHNISNEGEFVITDALIEAHDINLTVKVEALSDLIISINNTPIIDFTPVLNLIGNLSTDVDNNFTFTTNKLMNEHEVMDSANSANYTEILNQIEGVDFDVWNFPTRTLTEINLTNVTIVGNVSLNDQNLEDIARKVYEFFFFAGVFDKSQEGSIFDIFGGFDTQ